ncbi:uncharacterized protein BX664DRAFT_355079 [Halteromyces radiatus]|uniref:uncharacterized protein n=1 Tax=Halteromyces radiatus TaxID=101107 RepID=UPI00221FCC72|nr:uncharacterized protein BX664DRAFT_355079 [Halteromyces radiatus]KAI8099679.1 hypothetical protein BX664DRAFT_355079 [Halteromyces radiatus]
MVKNPDDATTIQIKKETTPSGQAPVVLVTGPYTSKNTPVLDDQRHDRSKPVVFLDRRTLRGDPPAWLPSYWIKPGVYPLPPGASPLIQMLQSFPFDRNAITPSSSASTTTPALSNNTNNVNTMLGPSMFQPNFYQQPNMFYGGNIPGNMMISPSMMPVNDMMSHWLQQQRLQQMLQYHHQQQIQAMSNPTVASPIPQPLSPSSSSSYTQRKPINTPIPMYGSPLQPSHTSSSSSSNPQRLNKDNISKRPTVTPSTSTSNSTQPKVQRKQINPTKSKQRVRFAEDPIVEEFEPYNHSMDEEEELYDDNNATRYYDNDYYQSEYDDDRQYYYNDNIDDKYYDNDYYQSEYDDDRQYYYNDNIDDNNDNGMDGHYNEQQDDDYWDEEEQEEIQRPWSTGRYMDYERSRQHSGYYSSQQRQRVTRHHSVHSPSTSPSTSSTTFSPHLSQQRQPSYHDSSLTRRSTTTGTSSTNPRMWQPSRNHRPQQYNASVSRSSSMGATSRRFRQLEE